MNFFDHNLPILRRGAGFTQESLAEALGVSRQAVSKWESGQTLPEASTLLTLAELLNCTLDQLMREKLEEDGPDPDVRRRDMEEEERFALFVAYDSHMNRHAAMMAGGVFLVLFGVGLLLALVGMGFHEGVVVMALMLCIAAAVFLFVFGGISHSDFQKAHPVLPPFYAPGAADEFRRTFRIGMAASVSVILVDVGLLTALGALFAHDETMLVFTVAFFFFPLGAAVAALVYISLVRGKYNLKQYMESAAEVCRAAGINVPDGTEMK